MAQQIKIADRIKNFVAHKLVLMAQAVVIQDAVIIDDDRIVHAAALGQVALAQVLKFLHQTKGSGPTHFFDKRSGGKINAGFLLFDDWIVIHDCVSHSEPVVGLDRRRPGNTVRVRDSNLFLDSNEFF